MDLTNNFKILIFKILQVSDGDFTAQASLPILVIASSGSTTHTHTLAVHMRSGGMLVLDQLTGKRLVLLQAPTSGLQLQTRSRGAWSLVHVGGEISDQDVRAGAVR